DFATKPIQILKVNALGTHKTLGLARAKGARYVLASTSEVYGDPLVHPQPEDYVGNVNPVGMRGAYDEGKRFAEAMTMAYHRHHGLDTRIVRIFNTYGERMRPDDGRMIPTFIGQALRGEPITVYGDGTQTRSFCYVSDMIEGIWRLSQLPGYHEPVNIGNPDERTVLEVAQLVKQLTGSASPVVFCPFFSPDEPRRRQPDITRARQLLGWEPQVSLEEGLRRTIEHFRARLAQR
ncbi:MAG: GDP-mannose 4,6-dehydratase, partial [Armatimonadota bacterium]|nr:GDP-mannose 4,6-dehydratase [Armatimonadota bacterium]